MGYIICQSEGVDFLQDTDDHAWREGLDDFRRMNEFLKKKKGAGGINEILVML